MGGSEQIAENAEERATEMVGRVRTMLSAVGPWSATSVCYRGLS